MPIITNYFSEIHTGHKDFVRSMIHFKQKSPLKPDDIKLRDIPNTEENKNSSDDSESDSLLLKEIKSNRKKKSQGLAEILREIRDIDMVQVGYGTLVTASEDKSMKLF